MTGPTLIGVVSVLRTGSSTVVDVPPVVVVGVVDVVVSVEVGVVVVGVVTGPPPIPPMTGPSTVLAGELVAGAVLLVVAVRGFVLFDVTGVEAVWLAAFEIWATLLPAGFTATFGTVLV